MNTGAASTFALITIKKSSHLRHYKNTYTYTYSSMTRSPNEKCPRESTPVAMSAQSCKSFGRTLSWSNTRTHMLNTACKLCTWTFYHLTSLMSGNCTQSYSLAVIQTITLLITLSTGWSVSAIHRSASSSCWSAWSSSSVLILITPAAGSDISSSYRWPAFTSSCCIHPLEHLASWYSFIRLTDWFQSD